MRPMILIAAGLALSPAASGAAANDASAAVNTAPETAVRTPAAGIDERQVINPLAAGKECPDTPMSLARKSAERPQLRHLEELPSAQVFAAVDRRVDNCPAPMVLSEVQGR
jgi:hypothetical protein